MSASVLGVDKYNEDSASPCTVTVPAGFASGQGLVAVLGQHQSGGSTGSMTSPDGTWSMITNTDQSNNPVFSKAFVHLFTGSEPATYDFPYGGSADMTLILYRIGGLDTTPTITAAGTTFAPATSTMNSPSVNPAGTDDLLICCLLDAAQGTVLSYTQPSGMTDQGKTQVTGNFMAQAGASLGLSSSAATGTKAWTSVTPNTTVDAITLSIVIKSAAGGSTINGTATLTGAGSTTALVTTAAPGSPTGAGTLTNSATTGSQGNLVAGGTLNPLATIGSKLGPAGAGSLTALSVLGSTLTIAGVGSLPPPASIERAPVGLGGIGTLTTTPSGGHPREWSVAYARTHWITTHPTSRWSAGAPETDWEA